MICTDIMQDASEIVHYNDPEIPIYVRMGILSHYPDMRALCHWHEDIELIYIVSGEMFYHINGRHILLKTHDCIIVNSRHLHYGYSNHHRDCKFICTLFHPGLLASNKKIYEAYVKPITENENIEYIHYDGNSPEGLPAAGLIQKIYSLYCEGRDAYALEIISCLYLLWQEVALHCSPSLLQAPSPDSSDLAIQKKMVSFIYEHYRDTVTLDEIAASGSISRSKCCIIFKKYLQQTPIDFLNKYRLEVSRYLLSHTESSVSQIALSCGFNHLSYFSKIFQREYGCTPTQYRNQTVSSASEAVSSAALGSAAAICEKI